MNSKTVIIIGAGACGLQAATILSEAGKTVIILEGRSRSGGRINTVQPVGFSNHIESGAEFIHGKLPITFSLLKKYKLQATNVGGQMYRYRDGTLLETEEFIEQHKLLERHLKKVTEDIPVEEFLNEHFAGDENLKFRKSVIGFVEGIFPLKAC